METEPVKDQTVAQPQVAAPTPTPTPVSNASQHSSGMAIAALVTGIAAIVTGWVPFLGLALGTTAVVLGAICLKRKGNKGMSIAGIVTGGLGALWSLAMTVFLIFAFAGLTILGGGLTEVANKVQSNISDYNSTQQSLIDAKKDFEKGSTATFENFEVKVNSVQRNYVPESEYEKASDGNELIVVNVSVTNISEDSAYFTDYNLSLNDNGVANNSSYTTVDSAFDGGNISSNATVTGNIVYEVTEGATGLKLQYETSVYDSEDQDLKTLTYTLAI